MSQPSCWCWFRVCNKISRLLWQFSGILQKTNLRLFSQERFCYWKYTLQTWLSIGKNRRSLSHSYQKIFKKQSTALTSGTDNRTRILSGSAASKTVIKPWTSDIFHEIYKYPESAFFGLQTYVESAKSCFGRKHRFSELGSPYRIIA